MVVMERSGLGVVFVARGWVFILRMRKGCYLIQEGCEGRMKVDILCL